MNFSTSYDDAYGFIISARTSYSAPICMYALHGSATSAANSGAAIISSAIPITRFIVSPFVGIILHAVARDLPIGNGSLMINFDHEYNIRDVYYPHVGQDNQTAGDVSFFGVWCDGNFAWIGDPAWIKTLEYDDDSLVTRVIARAPSFDLQMTISDTVDFDRDLFLRRVELRNLRATARSVRLYIHFDPHLYGNAIGDTIFFDPDFSGLVAYKGQRYVLINGQIDDQFGFQSFAIGSKERDGYQGTWRDAEDGNLQRNAIAQGSVDATAMLEYKLAASTTQVAWIWWAFGRTF